eukprot:CAMPEP_0175070800 /NCGR_PEP_ID=MMETSP0052_2-20121109/18906_1 /TAXON_ID=51329 ORGANISM="Polytomella parva, Strain SAG 63-3" /NCGR_SAMPLE_ID=MMETSP0052_2 /ASSEMBLY_ACC=CAM_ASM_000194 /LENGTH=631 /DNA_ID=CAMNT_0016337935 /DNA_START=55 /DNA_END=1951 /DNA_ORIENTATION=+
MDISKLPAPKAYPILGHLPLLWKDFKNVQTYFEKWVKERKGICRLWLAILDFVLVSDSSAAASLFDGESPEVTPERGIGCKSFEMLLGNISSQSFFSTSNQRLWRDIRVAITPCFSSHEELKSQHTVFLNKLRGLAKDLADQERKDGKGKDAGSIAVDLAPAIRRFALESTIESLFDTPVTWESSAAAATTTPSSSSSSTPTVTPVRGVEMLEDLNVIMHEATLQLQNPIRRLAYEFPLTQLFWTPARTAATSSRRFRSAVHQLVQQKVWDGNRRRSAAAKAAEAKQQEASSAAALRKANENNSMPLWKCLKQYRIANTAHIPTANQLTTEVVSFLVLAAVPTAEALIWTLHHLVQHPEWQDKLSSEIVSALASSSSNVSSSLFSSSASSSTSSTPSTASAALMASTAAADIGRLRSLPLLNALLDESLRLTNPMALALMRTTKRPITILGYNLPSDCTIWPLMRAIHTDAEIWGGADKSEAKALEFRPERWLQMAADQKKAEKEGERKEEEEGKKEKKDDEEEKKKEKEKEEEEEEEEEEEKPYIPTALSPPCCSAVAGVTNAPTAFIPFGRGVKSCPGQALAQDVLRSAVAMFVVRFKLEGKKEEEGEVEEGMMTRLIKLDVALHPKAY